MADIDEILTRTKTIALVGFSPKPERASHAVGHYLAHHGYRVIPINPGIAGEKHLGEITYASLADIPDEIHVDMVDIFRRSEDIPPVVGEALAAFPDGEGRTIWMQLGIQNEEAAQVARAAGWDVVQNKCTKIEHKRLEKSG
ncbi:CoA-binding protein [Paracoccaceae bacterium GXU_MW_L88]